MNGAHLHLIVNHVPVIGTIFAFCLLLWGVAMKRLETTRVGLGAVVIVALASIPAYVTGDGAEHVLKLVFPMPHERLHLHTQAAFIAFSLLMVAGALALLTLVLARGGKPLEKRALWGTVFVTLLATLGMGATGYYGGQIRHTEILDDKG